MAQPPPAPQPTQTPPRSPPADAGDADDPLAAVKEVFPGRLLGFAPTERERAATPADEPGDLSDPEPEEEDR